MSLWYWCSLWRTRRKVRCLRRDIEAGIGVEGDNIYDVVIALRSYDWPNYFRVEEILDRWDICDSQIFRHDYGRERDRRRAFKRLDFWLVESLENLLTTE